MFLFKYSIWGADVISDIPLDITNDLIKRKLIECKMQVDRCNSVTVLFLIKEGTIRAFPSNKKVFNEYILKEGKYNHKDFYEEDF